MEVPEAEVFECPCGNQSAGLRSEWKYYEPPRGWIAVDQYPPGDMGIGWRCSWACVEKFPEGEQ